MLSTTKRETLKLFIFLSPFFFAQVKVSTNEWKELATTPNMIFSVTYYLDLHGAVFFSYWNHFLSNNVVNVLECSNYQFNICW